MGLKDFLNKKPAAGDLDSLKGQSYNSTTAAKAPRKGHLPVAGNGPNTIENLQRVAKSRSHSHLKGSASPAPTSPTLARVQNLHHKRPSTSSVFSSFSNFRRPQSSHSTATAKRGNGEALLSPTNSTGSRKYGPYRIYKDDDAPNSGGVPPVPHIPDFFSRNGSIDSNSILSASTMRNKGYVDLLDAQSEFKPANFYSRLRATGGRNYGEDVADRNMLDGKASATSSATPTKEHPNVANEHALNRVSVIREDPREARYSPPPPEPIVQESVPSVAVRRRSGKDFDSERFQDHRKSFGEVSATNSKRRSKPKDLDLNLAVSSFSTRPSVSIPTVNRPAKAMPMEDEDDDDDEEQTPRQATGPASGAGKSQYLPRRAKSSASAKSANMRYAGKQQSHLVPSLPTKNRGEIGFIQSEAGQTDSDVPDDQSTSPAPSPIVSRHIEGVLSGQSRSQKSHRPSRRSSHRDSAYSQSRPSSSSSYGTQSRRQLAETTLQAVLDDIVENIPTRGSSLPPGPLRSESPPTTVSSMQSGNTFSPSRSYQTASTSIDGGRTPSVNHDGFVRTKSRGHGNASYIATREDQGTASRARQLPKETRNKRDTVDSQTSGITEDLNTTDGSDVEAYVAKRRQRKRDKEQEIVHSESKFGDIGKNLPGLFGNVMNHRTAGPQRGDEEPDTPRAPARFATADLEALFAARFQKEVLAPKSPYSERLTRAFLDASHSDAYDSDVQSTYSRDEDEPSRDRALRLLAAMKAQGLNVMDLIDLEESLQQRQERQDIKTAIRLRKEMKRIERMERLRSGGVGRRPSRSNGGSTAQGVGY